MIPTKEQIDAMPAGPKLDGLIEDIVLRMDRRAVDDDLNVLNGRLVREACFDLIPVGETYSNERFPILLEGVLYEAAWDRDKTKPKHDAGWLWCQREGKHYKASLERHVRQWRRRARAYSTDLALAWELFENLRNYSVLTTIVQYRNGRGGYCRIDSHRSDEPLGRDCWIGRGETVPLQICRARLQLAADGLRQQADDVQRILFGDPTVGKPRGIVDG